LDRVHGWIVLILQVFNRFVVVNVRDNIRLFLEDFLEQDHTQGSYVRISKLIENILFALLWLYYVKFGKRNELLRYNNH
jgi:hypothetical protein